MTAPFIEVRDLRKSYMVRRGMFGSSRELRAVAGISFAIPEGSTFGLVGESGSGKTTTAKMIMGAEAPTGGSITIANQDMTAHIKSDAAFRRILQPVLQDPYSSLSPRMRAGRIIDEPIRIHGTIAGASARNEKVRELLQLVGLPPEAAYRYPSEMSGGQRQRVAIARALSLEPRCIVLDEPVSALDVSIQAQILNLLKDLQRDLQLTFLLISHDLAIVSHMNSQIGVMYLGRLVEVGARAAILKDARHPYTLALIAGATPGAPQAAMVDGEIPSPLNPPSGCPFHTRCRLAADICRTDPPDLKQVGPEHRVACHFSDTSRTELSHA
ncbi:oligopeptide/dipeptide ABC transporter ATP-binding protein [Xanthobacter sp. DSM 24535]|uniref:ABC transporter ATP-binding protein n=1 Tax=Roseixanthobacter psychrophilus TaxID=3119917 RepID=UPI0037266560